MSSVTFVANIRYNNPKSFKVTIPRDLVEMIRSTHPSLKFLEKVRVEMESRSFELNYPLLAKGSGTSHYVLINSQTVRENDIKGDEPINVVVQW